MAALTSITSAVQLAAIADEKRLLILRLLMRGPATLTQLADELDSYPARVRHHVKRLEDVGLVRLTREVTTRNYTEKYYEATAAAYAVHLMIAPAQAVASPLTIVHCDAVVEELVGLAEHGTASGQYSTVVTGSLDGLIALKQGLADIAGCHLLDAESQEYNLPYVRHLFPGQAMSVVTLVHREQGLVVSPGNPMGIRDIADLGQTGVRVVNREPGSGTRTWFDGRLKQLGMVPGDLAGYDSIAQTHAEVATAVTSGRAHVGIAPRATALAAGLEFVPLFVERYDLVMERERMGESRVDRLLDVLGTRAFRIQADSSLGYDTSRTGDTTVTS